MKLTSKLVSSSTRAFVRQARRVPGYSLFDWLHGYVYARWPYLYIGIAAGEHPLARLFGPLVRTVSRLLPSRNGSPDDSGSSTFADAYHGKVLPLEAARQLVTVQEDINLTDLEQILPYTKARDIVLRNPDHIVALECPCRASRPAPCTPLDICLIIGEPFAGFVHEKNPRRSRWITQQEAEDILCAEHQRGHVHHAFFKDAMLGRFYAICNCCSCCCGAMRAWRNGTPMLASSGYVSQVDEMKCTGCGLCTSACPFGALSMAEDSSVSAVDLSRCMGCGVCVSRCEVDALALVRDPAKGEPLEIRQLLAEVAVCD